MLFLKPTQMLASTNLIVVTNLRRYAFELTAVDRGGSARAIYILRFRYPEDEAAAASAPTDPLAHVENLDFGYASTGARPLYPSRVFDDGASTYFQFPPRADLPAVFVIGSDGREEAVNTQMRGGYVVADRVSAVFVLRYGRLMARVAHGGTAPAPAPAHIGPPGRR
jgi:type IV secretion system protein VirB9